MAIARFGLRFILCALLLSLLCSCATVPYTGRSQLVLLDREQEMALGQQAVQQILKEEQLSRNPAHLQRVREVGGRIARAADRPDFRWEFFVVDDARQVNAFALPGGKVFVYTGMLRMTSNDAELATVIAHEVAHAIARHGAERMSRMMLAEMGGNVAAQALDLQSRQALDLFGGAYGLAANVGFILPHSRAQEHEADRIGLILMAKAGYDPRAALSFWDKMRRSGQDGAPPAFLSTHPTDQERLARIRSLIPEAMRYYRGA